MPYALKEAGFGLGILLVLLVTGITGKVLFPECSATSVSDHWDIYTTHVFVRLHTSGLALMSFLYVISSGRNRRYMAEFGIRFK